MAKKPSLGIQASARVNRLKAPPRYLLTPKLVHNSGAFRRFLRHCCGDGLEAASIAIFVAAIMDGLDGRIARLTNTQSAFGLEYDSLSDLISFGLAPALIVYQWSLVEWGKLGWLTAFIYVATTALRLARFNTQADSEGRQFFQGLPSPAAAALLAGMIWLGETQTYVMVADLVFFVLPITLIASVLMVSNIRFYSLKRVDFKGRVPFFNILLLVALFVFIALRPPLVLFIIALFYAISGPVMTLVAIRRRRQSKKVQEP